MQQPVDCNAPNQQPVQPNQPIVEYNTGRLEMLAFAQNLRRWLGVDAQLRAEFEMEFRVLFREFARAYPNAGVGELDAVQMILRLTSGAPGATTEFAHRIAGHPYLLAAMRQLAGQIRA